MRTLLGEAVPSLAQPQLEIMRVIARLTSAYCTGEAVRGQRGTPDITGHLLFRGWQCFARSAGWLGMHAHLERDTMVLRNSGGSCARILAHFRSSDHTCLHLPSRTPSAPPGMKGPKRTLVIVVARIMLRTSGTGVCLRLL